MKTRLLLVSLMGILVSLADSSVAQPVWRCGADGSSFSDRPCSESSVAAPLRPRPAADVQAASDQSQRDASLAESLRQERLQRELPPAIARSSAAKKKAVAVPGAPHKPHKKQLKRLEADGTFRAVAPGSRRNPG